MPLIEIHRVIYVGSGPHRQIVNKDEWKNRFRTAWSTSLANNGLKVEIFIWDNHHDRYLITDLIGITLGNGFDTTPNPNEDTTWANIGRKRRDEILRSFDPNTHRHTLKFRFSLP